MKRYVFLTCVLSFVPVHVCAECPLDHLIIGVNEDGIHGTEDDKRLFVDCRQKYRSSGTPSYVNWYYPLSQSIFPDHKWRIGEPGFDAFQNTDPASGYTYDPNRCLVGTPNQDYRIIVECVAISSGLRAVHKDYPQFTVDRIGLFFNHSEIHALRRDPHMHISYQAVDGSKLLWITWQLYDASGQYEASEPFTLVFNTDPLAGDSVVDGTVDMYDLAALSHFWLAAQGSKQNDYYERVDSNRDKRVDFVDFAMLASNWRQTSDNAP